ncbi:MAG: OmpH family outer membrane protein [Endomicrobia bacterium]|nr:OmpH family outer membrane protein [Endomicrobiia bacterium]
MYKKILAQFLFLVLIASLSFAVEIPINGSLQRQKKAANGIFFVDMEKIFDAHPMKERFKKEIQSFAATRKTAIEDMVKQYDALQKQIQDIGLKIGQVQVSTETDEAARADALADLSAKYAAAQKSAGEQKGKIADLSARTKSEIVAMEEKNSMLVMNDINIVLSDIAKRHNAEIVLDKQSILCGSESCEDITGEVIKKLEGR